MTNREKMNIPLSPMERRVMECCLQGMGIKETAEALGKAPPTIATHMARIRIKWGVLRGHRRSLLSEFLSRRENLLQQALVLLQEHPGVASSARRLGHMEE